MIIDYVRFYNEAYNYLVRKAALHNVDKTNNSRKMTADDLECYFVPNRVQIKGENGVNDIRRLFLRFCYHAQNGTIIDGVIKYNDNYEIIKEITNDFDINYVLNNYYSYNDILEEIKNKIGVSGKMAIRYARAIYSSAKLLSNFTSYEGFINYLLSYNEFAPTVINYQVDSIKDTLACDFLKETDSRFDVCKTDKHVKECVRVFCDLDLGNGDRSLFLIRREFNKICQRVNLETNLGLTAYKLDKILYLICTESFYEHDQKKNTDDKKRNEFIKYLRDNGIIS